MSLRVGVIYSVMLVSDVSVVDGICPICVHMMPLSRAFVWVSTTIGWYFYESGATGNVCGDV